MRTLRNGFTAEELASAKSAIRDERVVARASDAGVLNLIRTRERWNRTLAWDEELETKLERSHWKRSTGRSTSTGRSFHLHIDWNEFSIVKGGDFATVGTYR